MRKYFILILMCFLLSSCATTSIITLPDNETIVYKGPKHEKVMIERDGRKIEFDRKPVANTSEGKGFWDTLIMILTLGLVN